MVNQKDVGKQANVSTATVSAVLNNNKFVSEELKLKVLAAIDEIGYRPNLVARSLKIKETKVIGIIFPDINNRFFTNLILKVEDIAFKNGYNVILCNTENNIVKEKEYLNLLKGKQVDGYVIITTFQNNDFLEGIFREEKVIYVDRCLKDSNEICVQVDNLKGVKLGMEYLFNLGHKRIGFINIPLSISPGIERYEAYKYILAQNEIDYDEHIVRFADYSVESAYKQTLDLLSSKYKPTAIMSAGNMTSIGVLQAINELNLKIPKDISFIGFDEVDPHHLINPGITVIQQPDLAIGETATNLLFKKINRVEIKDILFLIEPHLIIRQSCKQIH